MDETIAAPASGYFNAQGLRLHYVDWGNADAPALVLVHGGRDHCRSWGALARALVPRFHVVAPDLRGHGDSEWAKGSSYSLADYVYDLAALVRHLGLERFAMIGHSMGGMIALTYAGTFPERVTRLAVLDGVTVLPGRAPKPMHEQIANWIGELDAIAARAPRRLAGIADAAARMAAYNPRLTPELALELATHGVRRNEDGSFSWKFDDYQQARAPYRLSPQDHVQLWSRIACPMLLMRGDATTLPDPQGALAHFRDARLVRIAGAGHWLHHDRPAEVLAQLREFLADG
jgi:pimeloyl-ACP methyl ester carboxylesterase